MKIARQNQITSSQKLSVRQSANQEFWGRDTLTLSASCAGASLLATGATAGLGHFPRVVSLTGALGGFAVGTLAGNALAASCKPQNRVRAQMSCQIGGTLLGAMVGSGWGVAGAIGLGVSALAAVALTVAVRSPVQDQGC